MALLINFFDKCNNPLCGTVRKISIDNGTPTKNGIASKRISTDSVPDEAKFESLRCCLVSQIRILTLPPLIYQLTNS